MFLKVIGYEEYKYISNMFLKVNSFIHFEI